MLSASMLHAADDGEAQECGLWRALQVMHSPLHAVNGFPTAWWAHYANAVGASRYILQNPWAPPLVVARSLSTCAPTRVRAEGSLAAGTVSTVPRSLYSLPA